MGDRQTWLRSLGRDRINQQGTRGPNSEFGNRTCYRSRHRNWLCQRPRFNKIEMNRRLGMSLSAFSNPTTRSSSLYSTCCPSFPLYLVSPLLPLYPTSNTSLISTVHVHSHPICLPRSLRPLLQPSRPLRPQPLFKISFHPTARFPRFRIRYHVSL